MPYIELTKGYRAYVDEDDFDFLSQRSWYAQEYTCGKVYACSYFARRIGNRGNPAESGYMHRLITQAPKGLLVDHIDGDGLNNGKKNLRLCTYSQNRVNSGKRGVSSQYKGVDWNKKQRKWRAIANNVYQGAFDSEIEAAKAYDVAALKFWGEFAALNFDQNLEALYV